ncbi:MAG: protein translocase subunit SecF [Chloroflexi bacterium]|nr:protein translocase subunit SecF [Chloroflexota bacterium]
MQAKPVFDFVGRRWWYFLLSVFFLVPGLVAIAIPPPFKWGIEFTSGTSWTMRFEQPVDRPTLAQALASQGHADAIIQQEGAAAESRFLVRTRTLAPAQKDESGMDVVPAERETITNALEEKLGPFTTVSYASVSPAVAKGIVSKVILALVLASVGILLYITYAFRKVPNPFRYGIAALIALVHDVALVMGVFSILGKLAGMEINAMFVTGLLTVAGYSVHDTIVVFDRIRENVRRTGFDLATTVNNSLLETLGRSLGTGITTLFVLVAMLLIGGATIKSFLLVLVIGIISGTYSSIFIAAQVLVIWEKHEVRRLWGWLPMLRGATTR